MPDPAPLQWRPIADLPNDRALHVVIRTPRDAGTSWRWLPYRKGAQAPWIGGRWQIATEHGWRNEMLPKTGEWVPSEKPVVSGRNA